MSESKDTRTDLGDDLLETRKISHTPEKSGRIENPESVAELLINAKILLNEGLLEDSKKTLRQVLRMDASNLTARTRLEEIQQLEIKKILGSNEGTTGGFVRQRAKPQTRADDADSVCAALERDIGPGKSVEDGFFTTDEERSRFMERLEVACTGATPQDRLDLGIGMLEMEFYDAAIALFRAAARNEALERKSRALLATAWVAKGNGFEAMIEIETLVADQSITPEEKVDFGYLAGRAQELLGNAGPACRWYRATLQIEPHYRDATERLAKLSKRG
jgi:tetratricopeptide (TPR) repeat protein